MGIEWIREYLSGVESEEEYDGYYYNTIDFRVRLIFPLAFFGGLCYKGYVDQSACREAIFLKAGWTPSYQR